MSHHQIWLVVIYGTVSLAFAMTTLISVSPFCQRLLRRRALTYTAWCRGPSPLFINLLAFFVFAMLDPTLPENLLAGFHTYKKKIYSYFPAKKAFTYTCSHVLPFIFILLTQIWYLAYELRCVMNFKKIKKNCSVLQSSSAGCPASSRHTQSRIPAMWWRRESRLLDLLCLHSCTHAQWAQQMIALAPHKLEREQLIIH